MTKLLLCCLATCATLQAQEEAALLAGLGQSLLLLEQATPKTPELPRAASIPAAPATNIPEAPGIPEAPAFGVPNAPEIGGPSADQALRAQIAAEEREAARAASATERKRIAAEQKQKEELRQALAKRRSMVKDEKPTETHEEATEERADTTKKIELVKPKTLAENKIDNLNTEIPNLISRLKEFGKKTQDQFKENKYKLIFEFLNALAVIKTKILEYEESIAEAKKQQSAFITEAQAAENLSSFNTTLKNSIPEELKKVMKDPQAELRFPSSITKRSGTPYEDLKKFILQ